ncbi:flagellar export protein FliJ [Virgibacillus halodenitrificans]|uniref:Flagellar FliJ protein n=1 Tax=Virgibacillus halodenitrificans TaxID=1482 RepID=A0ABR7VS38_VIRHA|nr:flagellar export protein FliJ [Virgibacillus halodenitrificans]MBD1224166.1 flagellar export protein FliJ [Virgibacillus halodenitrificans]MCG1028702.1 flagellar export protein FliJ [Virgibacillus halodenitrificans]MEC2160300.1 flagellar export protein FliJ [Virgibacillus halodenitrificans]MYL45963.1 flagellar export protein FliJ [Virgibacillus halodenitrificans]WHX27163.1 flagellar export protein FliJ [Virgibacillus halodenitrificans]
MSGTVSLSKVLQVRELEKNNAQKAYHQSMDVFEEMATRLYNILKKKEAAEATYETDLHNGASINKIKQQAIHIEYINKQINDLQSEVQQARNAMEQKQIKLTDAHMEMKKFEKVIQNRKLEEHERVQRSENIFMDELSIQQYLGQKNR